MSEDLVKRLHKYEAIEFLLWQYDRQGPVMDSHEAWEALRSAHAPIEIMEEMSPLTKAEMDIVLREAFPNVRDEDMGAHVALILCQKGPQDA